ncbi:MAG: radical SAM protein [Candidatus Brocadiae bacterium]|nr:radical SAM protein [Candidatus Brocadiia bacterium]
MKPREGKKPRAGRARRRLVVRQVECKTVLNRSSIGQYTMNCYTGCQHSCIYCYARFMQRFHPHPEPWGEFVDVKVNAPEALGRQLKRAKPGSVFVSSACDAWQPLERKWELTRECCRMLIEHGFRVNALTKNTLVLRDLDIFRPGLTQVGVTITTLDPRLAKLWEPAASSVEERCHVLQTARDAGLETAIMFGPLLPALSDGQDSLNALFERAAELDVDLIWVDAMNPRPRVWPSVGPFLRREFPELHDRYSRLLHDGETREAYVKELGDRVRKAARQHHLEGRLAGCP